MAEETTAAGVGVGFWSAWAGSLGTVAGGDGEDVGAGSAWPWSARRVSGWASGAGLGAGSGAASGAASGAGSGSDI